MKSLWTEFLQERVNDDLAYIQHLAKDIGQMNALREIYGGDWRIEERSRAIIFDESQMIGILREGIENDQRELTSI